MIRRLASGPAEGWLSLGLVLLMCLTMAWAIDDVAPVMGRGVYTDFLMWAAVGGVLFGFLGPQVGWGRWRTYLIGSIFAALLIPLVVGGILVNDGTLYGQFEATATATVNAYYDLVWRGREFTQEYGHHLLAFGLLVWATSMFAAYATFGHRRPMNAVVMVGVILVITMSLTVNEQLRYLIVFSLASLFLLIRFHALEEQAEWLRRRIGDPAAISGIYLRGGSMFIVLAVVGSLLLTQTARSAPLAGAWDGVSSGVIDMTRSLAKFLPGGPNAKSFDAEFGEATVIRGYWVGTGELDATINVVPGTPKDLYWRAVTFDRFDLNQWTSTTPVDIARPAGDPLLEGSADAIPAGVATRSITFTVTPAGYHGPYVLSPLTPETVDQDVILKSVGNGGFFGGLRRAITGQPYTVTATIPITDGTVDGGLEAFRLREAGEDYPAEVRELYLAPNPDGAMGPNAQALLTKMLGATAGGQDANPYDIAKSLEGQFRDAANFTYEVDVQRFPCAEQRLSTVECFATFKHGYCQYYATTMAVFLRELGIPSRIAEGYLPGDRDARTGEETLLARSRHEWVEVYFPGYGWVPFDPTGGNVARLDEMAAGKPGPSATPKPSSSLGPGSSGRATRDPRNDEPGGAGTVKIGGGPGGGLLGAIAVLLSIIVGAIAFMVWRRGPRGGTSPDRAYGTVTRMARRFGYGPRPDQTVYEYSGALASVLPDARPALETVARAKVESAYGRASLGADGLAALRDAERRLRVSLLRLVFRRRGRRPF